MIQIFALILTCCLIFPVSSFGEVIKGIYGVPSIYERDPLSYVEEMEKAGVNAVFVKPERDTIKWFSRRGFKVYVSVDAFGGHRAWKKYPDSRPVLADGSLLGTDPGFACHGGACPTHKAWRGERLGEIREWLREFSGEEGRIDGIWLDYIRYPGRWSVAEPNIPNTCYCRRCLSRFSADTGVVLPAGRDTKETASWIKGNCLHKWIKWKERQIESFAWDVRKVIDQCPIETRPLLGFFLVPWAQGERWNAVSYEFAQDAFQLATIADVISPMLYHKKIGRPVSWTGFMARYYEETVRCRVWPIVQAMDCTAEEFGEILKYVGGAGADGVLGYPFSAMKPDMWAGFQAFHPLPNFLHRAQSAEGIEVRPGHGECGEWVMPLPACEPGAEYTFRGEFWQRVWENGKYPEISIWGERFLLNTHWKSKVYQPLRASVRCPEDLKDECFRFINCNPEKSIRLRLPELKRLCRFDPVPKVPIKKTFFGVRSFPIGVYGANPEDLEQIKKLAVNTVVLEGRGRKLREQVEKCHEVGLRYVLSVPHDPDLLPVYLDEISEYVRPYDLAFYVNDEPGIHSFPTRKAIDVNRLIKTRFPKCATCMAVVRPQVCGEYEDGADFFLLDQYPVPFMPMTWLSDCMDECGGRVAQSAEGMAHGAGSGKAQRVWRIAVGGGRLGAVIQAFGGAQRLDHPRIPTWREMDCLAFLSVVHGARAIFFYTYKWIGQTEEGRERLGRVVGRLNRVYPWLVAKNVDERVHVEMLSENRYDPKGRPAVHCCLKWKGNEALLIAVNTIGTHVEAKLCAESMVHSAWGRGRGVRESEAREVFSGEEYVVVDGGIRVKLGPYETKAFLSADYAGYTD